MNEVPLDSILSDNFGLGCHCSDDCFLWFWTSLSRLWRKIFVAWFECIRLQDLNSLSICVIIACTIYVVSNLLGKPFQDETVNKLDCFFLVILVALAAMTSPQLAKLDFGTTEPIRNEVRAASYRVWNGPFYATFYTGRAWVVPAPARLYPSFLLYRFHDQAPLQTSSGSTNCVPRCILFLTGTTG